MDLRNLRIAVFGLLVGVAILPTGAFADCIDDAARYQRVDPLVLRAIAYHESRMRPATLNRNLNGSVDVGVMGINSVHFGELAGYGIRPTHLRDGCTNAYIGAYYLRRKIDKYGNTWRAVAAYHSETPALGAAYANAIRSVLARWGVLDPTLRAPVSR
ncbi:MULTISPECIES: lytic transglycosylase domain-containing protein [unclassified Luteibacter]|uniref:lytic transglycosylase domain-containing protein n=1 Tax=unclassified Luteibacter TaxID=2620188 RepID=UPI0008B37BAF|nr:MULTISPECIES: lytic transglycosylase domain-containing protein [unclassified Luteibacter]MDR6935157.1 soluble lytic murein transglycosylase-like protein [Luteibacter sp. 3190]SEV98654.1 Transglycosylase SLT domain-containing protein [Luteibacter sp. 329MFSha]